MTMQPHCDPVEATRLERLDLCDHLDTLTTAQWESPSLCAGWTVKDVVAHLTTSTRTSVADMVIGMIRSRGDFDRMELGRALAIAKKSTFAELVTSLRETAGSASRAPFSSPFDPLLDVLVHGQDITRALDQDRSMDTERAIPALDHAIASRWYGARARIDGLRLAATDADWTSGKGQQTVTGPIADLILIATGRPAGLAKLHGPGAPVLRERLAYQARATSP